MTIDTPEKSTRPTADETTSATLGWLNVLRSKLGLPGGQTLRDTLADALKGASDAEAFKPEEREIFLRLLSFGNLRVDDIMVPRADIIAMDESETLADLLRTFDRSGVSRVPVYNETLDDPRGMVHVKDLLRWMMGGAEGRPVIEGRAPAALVRRDGSSDHKSDGAATDVHNEPSLDFARLDLSRTIASAKLRRSVLFVPPSMLAMNLLIRMQSQKVHMALVVDEYGGTDGLVTIEDLVEQIVGRIEDEHDEAEAANIIEDPKLGLVAIARTPVKELEQRVGLSLVKPEDEASIDTLAGLVFSLVGRVPVRGELVRHPAGIEFEVLDADARRLKRVKIHLPRTPAPAVNGG
jgi:CBS domain containing-hemolysin-like protein